MGEEVCYNVGRGLNGTVGEEVRWWNRAGLVVEEGRYGDGRGLMVRLKMGEEVR